MKKENKMFSVVKSTWNPITGCPHNCIYCWARKMASGKLKRYERYKEGFFSRLNPEELTKKFNGGIVFVSDMGDIMAETVPNAWILKVIYYIRDFPNTKFLFLTKNPKRYHNFISAFPQNAILGATIETDDDTVYRGISRAPPPSERIKAMADLDWNKKFISIEPILKFTDDFSEKIREIKPFMVYVGYDNYRNKLPEPSIDETRKLISELSKFTNVYEKTIRKAWWER